MVNFRAGGRRQATRTDSVEEAARRSAAAEASVVTARDVGERLDRLTRMLARSRGSVSRLSDRARGLAAAERAVAAVRAAEEAARRVVASVPSRVRPEPGPVDYQRRYREAATTCPGLPWSVLTAIGPVESGHGRDVGPSSAGALGPMHLLPATFRAYGVRAPGGSGPPDPMDPADATFSAANYRARPGAARPGACRGPSGTTTTRSGTSTSCSASPPTSTRDPRRQRAPPRPREPADPSPASAGAPGRSRAGAPASWAGNRAEPAG